MIYIASRYYDATMITPMEFAIAHETGHQWWYSMVGSDQIWHPWQDEALTQYIDTLYFERFESKTMAQKIMNTYLTSGYKWFLDTKKDGIVERSVYNYKDMATYTIIVYI